MRIDVGSAGARLALPGPSAVEVAGKASLAPTKELKDLKKACEQFEAVFAKKLLSEMRKGVQEVKIGDSAGSEIYKDMMDQAIADSMGHQGALGIGKMLYKQFEKQVGSTSKPTGEADAAGGGLHLQVRESPATNRILEQAGEESKQAISLLGAQGTTSAFPLQGAIPTISTSTKR